MRSLALGDRHRLEPTPGNRSPNVGMRGVSRLPHAIAAASNGCGKRLRCIVHEVLADQASSYEIRDWAQTSWTKSAPWRLPCCVVTRSGGGLAVVSAAGVIVCHGTGIAYRWRYPRRCRRVRAATIRPRREISAATASAIAEAILPGWCQVFS